MAVGTSVADPWTDYLTNCQGTVNVLEGCRKSRGNPSLVFCSTNKVYGENVNTISVGEAEKRYFFSDRGFRSGVPETLSVDGCKHTSLA